MVVARPLLHGSGVRMCGCRCYVTSRTAPGACRLSVNVRPADRAAADGPVITCRCLAYLRQGDTLTVWKLDRLGRSSPTSCRSSTISAPAASSS